MIVEAELWAQEGTTKLLDPYRDGKVEITIAEAAVLIRAAYGAGYQEGLTEPVEGASLKQALAAQLMLPV